MNFLPHVHFTITSPLAAEQAFIKSYSAEINISGRNYIISKRESENNILRFTPERKLSFYHNSFLPTVKMDFHSAETGTTINLYAKLVSEVGLFLVIFVLLGFAAEIYLIGSCIKEHYFFTLPYSMPGIIAIVAYVMCYIGLYASTKSFQLQFEQFIGRKN